MLNVGEQSQQNLAGESGHGGRPQNRVHDLIEQRRSARRSGCKNAVKDASKVLRKEIRAIAKARKNARICKVLEEFKDLQRIAGIRGCGKQMCMTSVLEIDGTEKTEAGDIAEVFAAFFESLYQGDGAAFHSNEPFDRIDRVTTEEIRQHSKDVTWKNTRR